MPPVHQTELHIIIYGSVEISYNITFRSRKTLSISVLPTGEVLVVAPTTASVGQIAERVHRRAAWILRQRERFQQLGQQVTPARQFISGETCYYLGRQYRLKIEAGEVESVSLRSGRLWITIRPGTTAESIEKRLTDWYRQRAEFIIYPLFRKCLSRLPTDAVRKSTISCRLINMSRRWGSCSPSGIVRLHPDLIKTPKGCIEYIVWHELAHVLEAHHNKAFYALQERLMPDWRVWEERLRQFNPE